MQSQSNALPNNDKDNHEIIDKNKNIKTIKIINDENIDTSRDDQTFSCNKTSFLLNQSSDNSFDRESLIKIFEKFNEIVY